MANIEELEQKIRQLEKEILAKDLKDKELIVKSEKAIDYANHAYRVDHNAFIWVWDVDKKDYRKTKMRVGTPEVWDFSIEERKLADKSISTRTIQDRAVTEPKLDDNSVSTRTMQKGSVTKDKIVKGAVEEIMKPITDDLQNQIDSFNEHGLSVSNYFGSNPHIGISQKTLTRAINEIWYKLEDITGETLIGINLTLTPDYYIGEEGCFVNISAETVGEHGVFEYVKFYLNDRLIASAEDVHEFAHTTMVTDTSVIKCVAQILGVEYERSQIITHYNPFWLGAGTSYSNVMVNENLRPAARGSYNIPVAAGQRIYVIIEDVIRDRFIRADMNGVEIQFSEITQTIGGKTYAVLASENTYQAGEYNIDING